MIQTPSGPRAAVFDLDGTLIDSAPDIADAVNRAFVAHGLEATDEAVVTELIGNGAHRLVADLLARQRTPATPSDIDVLTAAYLDSYAEAPVARTTIYAHVAEDLATLKGAGWRLGLCTNKPQALTLAVLKGLGLAVLFDEQTDIFDHLEPGVVPVELRQDEERDQEGGTGRDQRQPLGVAVRRRVAAAGKHRAISDDGYICWSRRSVCHVVLSPSARDLLE